MSIPQDNQAIEELITLVGGSDNVISVSHCLTRLRFVLNDPNLADIDKIKKISFVKGCFNNAGQFQVIVGMDVDIYYKLLIDKLSLKAKSKDDIKSDAKKNMGSWQKLIANLAEIFVPLLPILICGGLLLGLRNVIGEMPISDNKPLTYFYPWLTPIYDFLWLPCEAIFHFLPVSICWSSVKKMGGTTCTRYRTRYNFSFSTTNECLQFRFTNS